MPASISQRITNFLDRHEVAGEVGVNHIEHLDHQHGSPPGVQTLTLTLLPPSSPIICIYTLDTELRINQCVFFNESVTLILTILI